MEIDSCRKQIEAVVLAGAGGGLGYVMRRIGRGRRVYVGRATMEMLSSGFVGYLIFLLCRAMKIDDAWVGPIVGVFGWIGAAGSMTIIESIAMRRFGHPGLKDTGERPAHGGGE